MVEFQIMGLVLTERIPILKNDGTMNELTYYHDPPRRQMRRASSLSNVFIPKLHHFRRKIHQNTRNYTISIAFFFS